MTEQLCTFYRDDQVCGKVAEDESVHVWPNERMRHGCHVWRHDQRAAHRLTPDPVPVRSSDYRRGYQAGYAAGSRR